MTGETQTTLLVGPSDVIKRSIIDSNVDSDSIVPSIYNSQLNKIKRILTKPLYDKILADYENDALADTYLIIYEDFVIDMLSYFAAGEFITTAAYTITNGGINRMLPENGEVADIVEISRLSQHYNSLGDAIEIMFSEWIKDNSVPEYSNSCGNNNSSYGSNWYFPQ